MTPEGIRANILGNFKEAGLPVSTTISRNANSMLGSPVPIVRLSINQNPMEHFMVDVGDEKNKVEILGIDNNFKQLVLLVKEPKREYKIPKENREGKIEYEIKHTDSTERRYLMGLDERHLFISGLPKEEINTVEEAHKSLKHKEVISAEREGKEIKRQGEYFFVPLTEKEEDELLDKIDEKKEQTGKGFKKNGKLRRNGHRIHFVKRLVFMRRGRKIFAHGAVTHEQHAPLILDNWHRVYKNRETESLGISGFID